MRRKSITSGPSDSTPGIVLRARTFGESDRIVTFLTRDHGKIAGIAKGALRSRRRFMGALEPSVHVRLGFRLRTGADLAFIESADIVRAPRNLGRDLERYAYTIYLLDVVDATVEGHESGAALFDLLESLLVRIDGEPPRSHWLRFFEMKLLDLAGLHPDLAHCPHCGTDPAEREGGARFDPRRGDLRCTRCGSEDGIPLSAHSVRTLRAIQQATLETVAPVAADCAGEVRHLLQTFVQHHARRQLRSPGLLRELVRTTPGRR